VPRLLLTWVGTADLKAAAANDAANLGPVAQALASLPFDEVHLLSNFTGADVVAYEAWLKARTEAVVSVHAVVLSGPTRHREIYEAVLATCATVVAGRADRCQLTFHLSPGTPAMHAMWLLVAKTQYPAQLIESSKEQGVQAVHVPFEISAELMPELLDARLTGLATGTPPDLAKFSDIIHRSPQMTRVLEQAARVAPRSVPILIEGESGTGKELLARAIHAASNRRGDFVAVNCGAIPHELIEAELFGHAKGAFTGATAQRQGVFEAANHGTLFLDELGELPREAQVKLLRALQEGEITRVGSTEVIEVDVRVVAATHRQMIDEVTQGRFREDLFYRLAVAVLKVPALRARRGDLVVLIDHLLARINRESEQQGFAHKKLSPGARNVLSAHPWPGNVRELENTLMRAVIWSNGATISVDEMRNAMLASPGGGRGDILHQPLGDGLKLPDLLQQVVQHYLKRAMEEAGGNKTEAAKLVGLASYQTLTNWLEKYKVST
jgi:transcriptional regulator with PAS, ATPase and Fis domain